MKVVRQTWGLLGAVLALAGADLAVHAWRAWTVPSPIAPLPRFDPDEATRITVTSTEATLALERDGDRWSIAAPVEAPADAIEVESLLAALSPGGRPDARVAGADLEPYGLASGRELSVEVSAADGVLLSLVVGDDAGGDSTWIRLSGDDAALRAPIGGRSRFERPVGAWRDRTVTDLDPTTVRAVQVRWPDREIRSERGPDGWTGEVDSPTLDRVVGLAARLRAAEVAAADRPLVPTIAIALDGDAPVTLELGQAGGVWTVRRDDGPTLWRIDAALPALVSDPSSLASRTLWREAPSAVTRVKLERDGAAVEIAREGGGFRAVRPAHLELDPQRVGALVAFLAAPRVEGWIDGTDLEPARRRWRIWTDRGERVLELGPDADRVWIRDAADPSRTGFLPLGTVRRIEAVLGG